MNRGLYWEAWKLRPSILKIGATVVFVVCGVMIWAGFNTNPNYGCVTGACEVTRNLVIQDEVLGVVLLVIMVGILSGSLYYIAKTLQEKKLTFEQAKEKIEKVMQDEPPTT